MCFDYCDRKTITFQIVDNFGFTVTVMKSVVDPELLWYYVGPVGSRIGPVLKTPGLSQRGRRLGLGRGPMLKKNCKLHSLQERLSLVHIFSHNFAHFCRIHRLGERSPHCPLHGSSICEYQSTSEL